MLKHYFQKFIFTDKGGIMMSNILNMTQQIYFLKNNNNITTKNHLEYTGWKNL